MSIECVSRLAHFTGESWAREETGFLDKHQSEGSSPKKCQRKGWSSVRAWNWKKTTSVLAREKGVSPGTVSRYRALLHKPKVTKWSALNTAGWNWNQSNSELAREHAIPIHVVIKKRRQLGNASPKRAPRPTMDGKPRLTRAPRFKIDWKSLDWSQPNIRLSERLGCTREFVRQKRAELGKPKLSVYGNRYKKFVDFLKERDWATRKDFATCGISYMTGRRYLLRAQKNYRPAPRTERRHTASTCPGMNWKLPNLLLDEIWGVRKGTSATYRSRMGMPPAAFRAGIHHLPERFAGAVEAERKRANAWNKNSLMQLH